MEYIRRITLPKGLILVDYEPANKSWLTPERVQWLAGIPGLARLRLKLCADKADSPYKPHPRDFMPGMPAYDQRGEGVYIVTGLPCPAELSGGPSLARVRAADVALQPDELLCLCKGGFRLMMYGKPEEPHSPIATLASLATVLEYWHLTAYTAHATVLLSLQDLFLTDRLRHVYHAYKALTAEGQTWQTAGTFAERWQLDQGRITVTGALYPLPAPAD